ncbi:MAG: hypothetical protein HKN13_03595 [Rhodothermales bacterium]|nr:hypothetical protein [Rhodothermales bacterium]
MNARIYPAIALVSAIFVVSASAQERPRFGFGTEMLVSTADNIGVGFRGRVSMPLNADFSFAIGGGMAGFVLRGRQDANWVFTPQISAILTLEGVNQAPYLIGGVGAYIPTGDPTVNRGGPTFHLGVGKVRRLNDTSLFYEVNPALIIEDDRVDLSLPVRIGVIF